VVGKIAANVLQLKAGVKQPNTFERFRSLDFRRCYVGVSARARGSFILLIFKKAKEIMDFKELRIGNFVEKIHIDYGKTTIKIRTDDLIEITEGVEDITYHNIPLTEEWLLKFGANWEGDYVVLEKDKLTIRTHLPNMKPASIFAYFDGIKIRQLKYVHELQNLYYAINCKEVQCVGF